MNEITIGKEEFKALSSDTRINIIKMLNERNYTLSELSKKLDMSSPTIKQHLETLVHSDLIEQKDEGRKWKYYCLTRKGKRLIQPETDAQVMILLSASIIGLIAIAYLLVGTGITQNGFWAPAYSGQENRTGAFDDSIKATAGTNIEANEKLIEEDKKTENNPIMPKKEPDIYLILALITTALISGFLIAKTTEKKAMI